MSTVETLYTAEEFGRLESDQPCELVRGRIVEMNMPYPEHGLICSRIVLRVGGFVEGNKLGFVVGNDSGIVTERDPDTVRGADVAYYSYQRVPKGTKLRRYLDVSPDLVFEVRSPSERWGRLMRKTAEYLEAGVSIVCIVEPERELVHIHEADGSSRTLGMDDRLEVPTVLPGFSVTVRELLDA